MDEQAASEVPEPSTDAGLTDDEAEAEDDEAEVEGHSMAISANFSIDIGVAKPPPPVSAPPTDPKPPVR